MSDKTVSMTIIVPVASADRDLSADHDDFDIYGENYVANFEAEEFSNDEKHVNENNELVLSKTFTSPCQKTGVDGVEVCTKAGHSFTFECKYSLADQTLTSDDFDVSGSDVNASALGEGTLGYSLTLSGESFEIGKTASATITPDNSNLVYAYIKQCQVMHDDSSVPLLTGEYDSISAALGIQKSCEVQADAATAGGEGNLKFSWQSFKWNTANASDEAQTVQCTIGLKVPDQIVKVTKSCARGA